MIVSYLPSTSLNKHVLSCTFWFYHNQLTNKTWLWGQYGSLRPRLLSPS